MTILNLIALLCAASAWLVTRRAPHHRPVAVALSLCGGLDAFRALVTMPASVDLLLCLVAPAASAGLYAVALGRIGWVFPACAVMGWGARGDKSVLERRFALRICLDVHLRRSEYLGRRNRSRLCPT